MLRWRLLSAAILLSVLTVLLVLDYRQIGTGVPGVWLLPVAALFLGLGAQEMLDLFRNLPHRPEPRVVHASVQLVALSAAGPVVFRMDPSRCPLGAAGWPLLMLAVAVGLVFLVEMQRYREPGQTTVRLALSVLAIVYVGFLGSFLVALRLMFDNQWGMAALVSTILIVKLTDTGAYFTGRLFGRHPMAPRLSPKKTIEGGIGGVVVAVAASGFFFEFLLPRFVNSPPDTAAWRWMVHGLVVSLAGTAGDLAESLLKRDLGIKDASQRLPGMGGILDVLDSLLLGAPAAYGLWLVGLVGPGT